MANCSMLAWPFGFLSPAVRLGLTPLYLFPHCCPGHEMFSLIDPLIALFRGDGIPMTAELFDRLGGGHISSQKLSVRTLGRSSTLPRQNLLVSVPSCQNLIDLYLYLRCKRRHRINISSCRDNWKYDPMLHFLTGRRTF
jgi:hypothetical protein